MRVSSHLLAPLAICWPERAGLIAAEVKGVRAVVNALEVQPDLDLDEEIGHTPPRPTDAALRRAAQSALQSDPATQLLPAPRVKSLAQFLCHKVM
jgi:hypothetical protein